jgi:methanogenic corrinoid protein MtbC1
MYADEIGADGYAADASAAVELFQEVYPKQTV